MQVTQKIQSNVFNKYPKKDNQKVVVCETCPSFNVINKVFVRMNSRESLMLVL